MMKYLFIEPALLFSILLLIGACSEPRKATTYRLAWEDHFNTNTLDSAFWSVQVGDGCPELCGFGNNELQYYSDLPENIRITDGTLIIEAHRKTKENRNFTSSKVTTEGKLDMKWGKIEVRAKLPKGRGTWPAIWMLPTIEGRKMKWPDDGEIDIMEHVGYNMGMIYGTIHTKKYNHMIGTQRSDSMLIEGVNQDFHTYSIEWTEGRIAWFVDDQLYNELNRKNDGVEGWPFNEVEYHLILNLAVGGNWGGKMGVDEDIWPQQFVIDYVKYFQVAD